MGTPASAPATWVMKIGSFFDLCKEDDVKKYVRREVNGAKPYTKA
jgi:hypothetical protein